MRTRWCVTPPMPGDAVRLVLVYVASPVVSVEDEVKGEESLARKVELRRRSVAQRQPARDDIVVRFRRRHDLVQGQVTRVGPYSRAEVARLACSGGEVGSETAEARRVAAGARGGSGEGERDGARGGDMGRLTPCCAVSTEPRPPAMGWQAVLGARQARWPWRSYANDAWEAQAPRAHRRCGRNRMPPCPPAMISAMAWSSAEGRGDPPLSGNMEGARDGVVAGGRSGPRSACTRAWTVVPRTTARRS
jgi:hypothetical protein